MIIALIFILAGIIFLIWTLIYVKNKNNLQEINPIDKKETKKIKRNLKNIWGIDGFNNKIINTNKRQSSIVIELESIEYNLLQDEEKNIVDRELISIAQMLKFPIQFLEIKEQVNMEDDIENIRLNTINSNNYIRDYAENIIAHLETLSEDKDLFQRKNYMIISSFNNKRTAEIELKEFYQLLRYHLSNIKVSTRIIDDIDIEELIYEQLHKGSKSKILDMVKKGGLELYVTT